MSVIVQLPFPCRCHSTCRHSRERTRYRRNEGHSDFRRKERLRLSEWSTIKDPIQSIKDRAREWKKRKEKEGQGRSGDIAVARDALSAIVRRWIGAGKRNLPKVPQRVYENVNYKRKRCAPACRQQCTPLLLFERITMDHVGETGLMVSGWDVPRTEPVVRSRRFYAPLFQLPLSLPFSTRYSGVFLPTTTTEQPMNNFEYRSPPFALRFTLPLALLAPWISNLLLRRIASHRYDRPESTPPPIHRLLFHRLCIPGVRKRPSTCVFDYVAILKHLQRIEN